ncbi:lantibiotic dehydratase [Kitasatospora sp. NPDC059327]|uniref:lantibiotic dehydratase n=1 Tax=Kitasatospora sp. NPDC059327 TaxID=3346803 RepID=UPI00368A333A
MHTPYKQSGAALLRAAAAPLAAVPARWPDLSDTAECRSWLAEVWSRPGFADAVREASDGLAERIDALLAGRAVLDKHVCRAAVSTARYLLRFTGRPTPFGLFAGIAHASLGSGSRVRWGSGHRPIARVDAEWLAGIIDALESCPALLDRLDVVFNNLAAERGSRLQVPYGGPNRVSIRHTAAIRFVQETASVPVPFAVLAERLTAAVGQEPGKVTAMLTELVGRRFLITALRAPLTVTDPLGHLLDRLHDAKAATLPVTAELVRELETIHAELHAHNRAEPGSGLAGVRRAVRARMRELSGAGRTPLALDLVLDCDIRLPGSVATELERAAGALLRLTRQPSGEAVWRDYHLAFWERYSIGTLVPLTELVDPATGLGFPAQYPGSTLPEPVAVPTRRDERLLALAWQAVGTGQEIVLTDQMIDAITDGRSPDPRFVVPHVEMAARVHADSTDALDRGEFTVTVSPARSAGTLTSRFSPAATGTDLAVVYAAVPAMVEGALSAQLSFPTLYAHAENVARIPAYLPYVISLGEHRSADRVDVIEVDDLAVTATRDRLFLVSMSRMRVVEPQVFHAVALDKQTPPLARFLAHLPRAFAAAWTGFDWGPAAASLPFLPRVRYGRCVLVPARWQLTAAEAADLDAWRSRWHCPAVVDWREDDRTLRLDLTIPAHAAILAAELAKRGRATLTEPAADRLGWIEGHAHEIALPLTTTGPQAPSPLTGPAPRLATRTHGHQPGTDAVRWLNAKIPTHPELLTEIVADRLPKLLSDLGNPVHWFVRYRTPRESDHLRLRLRVTGPGQQAEFAREVGEWAEHLRQDGLAAGVSFDAYTPEIGRYGTGRALEAAEAVFAADSRLAAAALRSVPAAQIPSTALVALGMLHIAHGFFGVNEGTAWLAERPARPAPVDRAVADRAVALTRPGALATLPGWTGEPARARQDRKRALAAYRRLLPEDVDTASVVESLLHMHHNRLVGLDPDGEAAARRLARQLARFRQEGQS